MDLEAEFEKQLESHKRMEKKLAEKTDQITKLEAEGERMREPVKARERTIWRFTTDLHTLATEEQDKRKWPAGIRKIYREHVHSDRVFKDSGNFAMQELSRQTQVMQNKASTMAV